MNRAYLVTKLPTKDFCVLDERTRSQSLQRDTLSVGANYVRVCELVVEATTLRFAERPECEREQAYDRHTDNDGNHRSGMRRR